MKICSACCNGKLHPKEEQSIFIHNNVEYHVILYFSLCDYCGSELSNAEDVLKGLDQIKKIKENA